MSLFRPTAIAFRTRPGQAGIQFQSNKGFRLFNVDYPAGVWVTMREGWKDRRVPYLVDGTRRVWVLTRSDEEVG